MPTTLAEVLRHFGAEYLRTHALSSAQARAWRAIVACCTRALGGLLLRCDHCAAQRWRWQSCRNRHCPQCQSRQRDAWRAARLAELLNVPYCHLVFTLPHEINALAAVHARWVYDTLMQCTAATLSEFAANPRWLGGIGAFTLVRHTWSRTVPCSTRPGGLSRRTWHCETKFGRAIAYAKLRPGPMDKASTGPKISSL